MKTCPACGTANSDTANICKTEWCLYRFPPQDTIVDPGTQFLFDQGDVIADKYIVDRRLGNGGMGSVYLVKSVHIDIKYALKVLHPVLAQNRELVERFKQEIIQLLHLGHDNIVRAHDYDTWKDHHFFTMEYVEGISLDRLLASRSEKTPPFSVQEAARIMDQLLAALVHAHGQTIHRDIKPANIMITGQLPDSDVKVLDFGIAKAMSASRFEKSALAEGAFFYIAPEQSRGQVDVRSDLFSAGVVFYEMLTGEVPGGFPLLPSELVPGIPGRVDAFVRKSLSARPEDRFQTAQEMKNALEEAMAQKEMTGPPAVPEPADSEEDNPDREKQKQFETLYEKAGLQIRSGLFEQAAQTIDALNLLGLHPEKVRIVSEALAEKKQAQEAEAQQEAARKEKQREAQRQAEARQRAAEQQQQEGRRKRSLLLFSILALVVIAGAGLFFYFSQESGPAPGIEPVADTTPVSQTTPAVQQRTETEPEPDPVVVAGPQATPDPVPEPVVRQEPETPPPPPPPVTGALEIRSDPVGVTVHMDNVYKGITPLALRDIKAGNYSLRFSKTGYYDKKMQARVTAGGTSRLSQALELIKYKVFVETVPASARVRILNINPKFEQGMALAPGRYHIEVSASGYVTRKEWHEVTGQDLRLDVPLAKVPPPVNTRAWQKGAAHVNRHGMALVRIKPGSFTMGSPGSEHGHDQDEARHRVTLTRGFYLMTTEVTQGQWRSVMGSNPAHFKNGDDYPVESVSWDDAQVFIKKLNAAGGRFTYRLPTEAEWEYAARAGATGPLYTGPMTVKGRHNSPELDVIAWYGGNSCRNFTGQVSYDSRKWKEKQYGCDKAGTRMVGQKAANAHGLYDMIGNVWEWCQDWYGPYPENAVTDPKGPGSGKYRIYRGGSWFSYAKYCRAAIRSRYKQDYRDKSVGLRLAAD